MIHTKWEFRNFKRKWLMTAEQNGFCYEFLTQRFHGKFPDVCKEGPHNESSNHIMRLKPINTKPRLATHTGLENFKSFLCVAKESILCFHYTSDL